MGGGENIYPVQWFKICFFNSDIIWHHILQILVITNDDATGALPFWEHIFRTLHLFLFMYNQYMHFICKSKKKRKPDLNSITNMDNRDSIWGSNVKSTTMINGNKAFPFKLSLFFPSTTKPFFNTRACQRIKEQWEVERSFPNLQKILIKSVATFIYGSTKHFVIMF